MAAATKNVGREVPLATPDLSGTRAYGQGGWEGQNYSRGCKVDPPCPPGRRPGVRGGSEGAGSPSSPPVRRAFFPSADTGRAPGRTYHILLDQNIEITTNDRNVLRNRWRNGQVYVHRPASKGSKTIEKLTPGRKDGFASGWIFLEGGEKCPKMARFQPIGLKFSPRGVRAPQTPFQAILMFLRGSKFLGNIQVGANYSVLFCLLLVCDGSLFCRSQPITVTDHCRGRARRSPDSDFLQFWS